MATTWNPPLHAAAAPETALTPANSPATAVARPELKALTSLRFVAALMVFMDHAPVTEWASHHLGFGAAGVGFFFLLSGFVLMYSHGTDFGPEFAGRRCGNSIWRGLRASIRPIWSPCSG